MTVDVNWKFVNVAKTYRVEEWESYMCMLDREHSGIRGYLEKVDIRTGLVVISTVGCTP